MNDGTREPHQWVQEARKVLRYHPCPVGDLQWLVQNLADQLEKETTRADTLSESLAQTSRKMGKLENWAYNCGHHFSCDIPRHARDKYRGIDWGRDPSCTCGFDSVFGLS